MCHTGAVMVGRSLALVLAVALPAWGQTLSPEVQLCLQHFRAGERARAEKALGGMDGLPLYRVELNVDPSSRSLSGHLQISYPVKDKALGELYLRLTPNATSAGRVELSKVMVEGRPVSPEEVDPGLVRVRIDPAAAAGTVATLQLAFSAQIPKALPGSGSISALMGSSQPGITDHGAFSYTPAMIGLVGVIPMVPPTDERGEPTPGPTGLGDLALYPPAHVMAAITVPRGWRVHATGEPMGEVPERDGRIRFSFGAAGVRDFPVLVSRGYEVKTEAVDDLIIESDFAAEDREMGERVLHHAAAAVTELQRRLGPLPYKRLKVVEAPLTDGAGGMEFPGLFTISTALYRGAKDPSAALLGTELEALAPLLDSPDMKQLLNVPDMGSMLQDILEFSVAHETAHQYFAGLVGSDPIREPVVDESLAQYVALLYWEWRHGKLAAEKVRQEQLVTAYQMYRMLGGQDGAADRPTSAFGSSLEYAALVYGKGPLLHAEERRVLGDTAFFRGLRAYIDAYRYRWSCSACLSRVLASESPGSAARLDALRRHWWQERHGDEDLGKADLSGMLSGVGGAQLDPQTLQMMQQLMQQLLGQGQ